MYFKPKPNVIQSRKSINHIYKNTPTQIHNRVLDHRCILNDSLKRQQVSGAENIVEYNNKYFDIDVIDMKDFKMTVNDTSNNNINNLCVINWKMSKDDGYVLYGFDCLMIDDENVKEIRRYFDEGMTIYSNDELDYTL